jgi:plasmid stabilization system protein ParE
VRTVRIAPGAITDIRRVLHHSKAEFGADAEARYKALLEQALQDLGEDPRRLGVRPSPTSALGTSSTTLSSASRELAGARLHTRAISSSSRSTPLKPL